MFSRCAADDRSMWNQNNVTLNGSVWGVVDQRWTKALGIHMRTLERATNSGDVGLQGIVSAVGLFANTCITLNHEWNITWNYAARMHKTIKH